MDLRDYQIRAINQCRDAYHRGKRAPLIVLPTGGGKTALAMAMAKGHLEANKDNRVVWLAHRHELVAQAKSNIETHRIGDRNDRMSVRMVQGILHQGVAPPATLLVLDEAHHFAADEWSKLAKLYEGSIRVGLTATPERADGRGLGDIFDELIVGAQIRELQEAGHLVKCRVIRPRRELDKSDLAQDPVSAYLEHAPGTLAVVFAKNRTAGYEYLAQFRSAGIGADIVLASTHIEDRRQIFRRFDSGDTRVLINLHILTEGWDCPKLDTVILAKGGVEHGLYLQMIGRVMRPWLDKEEGIILDLHGASHRFGPPDADREFSLEGQPIKKKEKFGQFCAICSGTPEVCRCEVPAFVQKAPKVVNEELEEWVSEMNLSPTRKILWLAKEKRVARARGYKPGWANVRFFKLFKKFPTRQEREAAETLIARTE